MLVLFFLMMGTGNLFGGVGMPAWVDIIARMLPGDWRGRFFGLSAALGGLLGVAGAAGAAEILHRFTWPSNFALCFACTFVCLAVSYAFICLCREPPPAASETPRTAREGYWRRLPGIVRRDRNFRLYLAASALINMAGMAASFYAVDAKRSLGLSDAGAGVYAVALLAASMAGNLLWGYVGDHLGHKHVVEAGAVCTGLAALLAILARAPLWGDLGYGIVFVLVGLGTSGIQLAALTFLIDFAPPEQRPTYVGLGNIAAAPFAFGAPLVGGLLADRAGYPLVFALAAALALCGAMIVVFMVIDPRMQAVRRAPSVA
jgi:MFS family permease